MIIMKRFVLFIGLILFCCSSAFSQDQELKEFADPKERICDDHMFQSFGATTQDGIIVVYSAIQGLNFEILQGKKFLKDQIPDTINNRYILVVVPTGGEYPSYKLRIRASNYRYIDYDTGPISGGGRASCCIEINPKQSSPLEKLARITVYDKDNKLLVGAVVKNKTTGKVYGSTRYDGTLAINFENKEEMANVIISHPSYSDTKEIIVQAGIHDYKVNLRNYSPPSKQKTNAMWYIVPGLGEIEFGRKVEGGAIIAGEALLLGGGVISSVAAKKQLEIMRDVDVSLEDFMNAKSKYGTLRTVNVVCYVGAAALYGFHLYRVYHLSKEARNKRHASLTPTIMSIDESMALGLSININF